MNEVANELERLYHNALQREYALKQERDALARTKLSDQAAYVAMRAERDALRADAERYRALPTLNWYVGPTYSTYNDDVCEGEYYNHAISKSELDAAIDAAMKGTS